MDRRAAIVGSGALVTGAVIPLVGAESSVAGAYDVTLGVQPGKVPEEFLCKVSLRSDETPRMFETEGSFKRGSIGTLRTGGGRPDGTFIDIVVDVTVDGAGQRAEFVAKVTDRGKLVTTQRTSVSLTTV
jgi:hypothetical protein